MKDLKELYSLKGKTAIVTGAAGGIGEACAFALADVGANVVLTDIQEEKCAGVAERIRRKGGEAISLLQDVTSEEQWAEVIDATIKKCGGLNVLVNNAGIENSTPLVDISLEDWRNMQAVNTEGVFLGMKHAVIAMRPGGAAGNGGSIINVSSVAGFIGFPGLVNYSASKGAVRLMTKAAAVECGTMGMNVRVNSVHPGIIKTPMFDACLPEWADLLTGGDLAAITEVLKGEHPIGRFGEPMEIAAAIAFLASDASSFMTGTEIVIDGGMIAGC